MKAYLLALGLGLVVAGGSASAADLYMPQPAPAPSPMTPAVEASGWYLRGDVGYAFNDIRGVDYDTATGSFDFDSSHLDDAVDIGIGAGYQLTRHLRFDVTGDYMFKADFHGTTSGVCPDGSACHSDERGSLHMYSLLANAYVDLGTWHRVTPYIGGGVGATYVNWKGFTSDSTCAGTGCTPASSYDYDGRSDWRFTYALMAGASVDLSCNLKFDAGYRFRHVDGGDMFSGAPGVTNGRDDGFNISEVRGGLRYVFNGCDNAAPSYASYEPAAPVYK